MDTMGIAAAVTGMKQTQTADAVQMAVLKKILDTEAQVAMQLIEATTQVTYNNPPNLGNSVNTFA